MEEGTMARAYSQDLRDRVIDAALGGMAARRAAAFATAMFVCAGVSVIPSTTSLHMDKAAWQTDDSEEIANETLGQIRNHLDYLAQVRQASFGGSHQCSPKTPNAQWRLNKSDGGARPNAAQ
jgi:hypothetical protein